MQKRKTKGTELTGRQFDALSAAEKQRIFDDLERGSPERRRAESSAPTAAERTRLNRVHKKMGRPKIGKGVKVVSVSVEAELLKHADACAKHAGLKRTELFTRALRAFLPKRHAS
jgi:hypothetical protein